MKPLLAHIYESPRVSFPCYVQPKLNGVRALYQNGHFQSRDEVPFSPGLLDHLSQPLKALFQPDIILDGELYVHGWPLQRINAAVTPVRQMPTEDTKLVEYHVFDRVDYGQGFLHRWQMVAKMDQDIILSRVPDVKVQAVTTAQATSLGEADRYYSKFVSQGYEGMMYRIDDCPYTLPKQPKPPSQKGFMSDKNNRSWSLLKRKSWLDHEFKCVGIVEGEGKFRGMTGALVCEISDRLGLKRFNVSSGLSDQQRKDIWELPDLAINHRIKVRFLCLSTDGVPLNPTIEAIL